MKKYIFLFCLMIFVPFSVFADTWQVYTEASGLADSHVNCFATLKTYMAVGTNSGVSIYNGDTVLCNAYFVFTTVSKDRVAETQSGRRI